MKAGRTEPAAVYVEESERIIKKGSLSKYLHVRMTRMVKGDGKEGIIDDL
jgi:hypothetical protein